MKLWEFGAYLGKSDGNAADGPSIAHLEKPLRALIRARPSASVRTLDVKSATIRFKYEIAYKQTSLSNGHISQGWAMAAERWEGVAKRYRGDVHKVWAG